VKTADLRVRVQEAGWPAVGWRGGQASSGRSNCALLVVGGGGAVGGRRRRPSSRQGVARTCAHRAKLGLAGFGPLNRTGTMQHKAEALKAGPRSGRVLQGGGGGPRSHRWVHWQVNRAAGGGGGGNMGGFGPLQQTHATQNSFKDSRAGLITAECCVQEGGGGSQIASGRRSSRLPRTCTCMKKNSNNCRSADSFLERGLEERTPCTCENCAPSSRTVHIIHP
jgi:hypothetical protein